MKFKDFYIGQKVVSKKNRVVPFYTVIELNGQNNEVMVATDNYIYAIKKADLKIFVPYDTPIRYTKAQLESFTKEELINIILKKEKRK